jgi:hypothetical protein
MRGELLFLCLAHWKYSVTSWSSFFFFDLGLLISPSVSLVVVRCIMVVLDETNKNKFWSTLFDIQFSALELMCLTNVVYHRDFASCLCTPTQHSFICAPNACQMLFVLQPQAWIYVHTAMNKGDMDLLWGAWHLVDGPDVKQMLYTSKIELWIDFGLWECNRSCERYSRAMASGLDVYVCVCVGLPHRRDVWI